MSTIDFLYAPVTCRDLSTCLCVSEMIFYYYYYYIIYYLSDYKPILFAYSIIHTVVFMHIRLIVITIIRLRMDFRSISLLSLLYS